MIARYYPNLDEDISFFSQWSMYSTYRQRQVKFLGNFVNLNILTKVRTIFFFNELRHDLEEVLVKSSLKKDELRESGGLKI